MRELYKAILKTLGLAPNEAGELAAINSPEAVAKLDGDVPLCFVEPGEDVPSGTAPFDPANDVGSNAQCTFLARRYGLVTSAKILGLFLYCCAVSTDQEKKKKLGTAGGELLAKLGKIDEETLKFAVKLIGEYGKRHANNPATLVARFTAPTNRQIRNIVYTRAGIFTSPIYEFVREENRKENPLFSCKGQYRVLGVTCRRDDYLAFRAFLATAFPGLNETVGDTPWAVGTKTAYANFMFSLTKIFIKVNTHIIKLLKSIGVSSETPGVEFLDLSWEGLLDEAMKQDKVPGSAPKVKTLADAPVAAKTLGPAAAPASAKKVRSFGDEPQATVNKPASTGLSGHKVQYVGGRPVVVIGNEIHELTDGPGQGVRQTPTMPTPVEGTLELNVNNQATMLFTDNVRRVVRRDNAGNYVSAETIIPPGTSPRVMQRQQTQMSGSGGLFNARTQTGGVFRSAAQQTSVFNSGGGGRRFAD